MIIKSKYTKVLEVFYSHLNFHNIFASMRSIPLKPCVFIILINLSMTSFFTSTQQFRTTDLKCQILQHHAKWSHVSPTFAVRMFQPLLHSFLAVKISGDIHLWRCESYETDMFLCTLLTQKHFLFWISSLYLAKMSRRLKCVLLKNTFGNSHNPQLQYFFILCF